MRGGRQSCRGRRQAQIKLQQINRSTRLKLSNRTASYLSIYLCPCNNTTINSGLAAVLRYLGESGERKCSSLTALQLAAEGQAEPGLHSSRVRGEENCFFQPFRSSNTSRSQIGIQMRNMVPNPPSSTRCCACPICFEARNAVVKEIEVMSLKTSGVSRPAGSNNASESDNSRRFWPLSTWKREGPPLNVGVGRR